jgi:hypothetical protein
LPARAIGRHHREQQHCNNDDRNPFHRSTDPWRYVFIDRYGGRPGPIYAGNLLNVNDLRGLPGRMPTVTAPFSRRLEGAIQIQKSSAGMVK